MNDKLTPEYSNDDGDASQKHMRVEAALSKLIQDYPNSGGKALIDTQKGVAQPIQIDMLAHPDRGLATPDGQLTELGEAALKSLQNKINEILRFDSRKSTTPSIERVGNEPEQAVRSFTSSSVVRSPVNELPIQNQNKSKNKTKQGPEIN
ncbi:hypothetical protein ICN10_01535 [Polynucleobacter sp. 86C-FISCH]|uniref:hypothetical protein n=1 Tax=Polynucleobacter sp. 86C-FISCH TaxID=2689101 RepID=UPI001C0DC13C|nr:hypothetical protein [Polynucleobacter sp. 86C-FISCH]MBU3595078.1 hypothetical protein [Polynucleobacter sp. 86C-FISCH]